MALVEHLLTLRARLSVPVAALLLGTALCYGFRDQLLVWLQAPLHATSNYSGVAGSYHYLLPACLLVGLLLSVPVVVYQLVSPSPRLVALSCALTLVATILSYLVWLPLLLRFLTSAAIAHLHPLIAAGSYLGFVIACLAVSAVIVQLPLLLLVYDRHRPISPATLKRCRKWVVIGAFGAAIILPIVPDPVSQVMLALPVALVYELSLWMVVLVHRHRAGRPALALPARTSARPVPAPRATRPGPTSKRRTSRAVTRPLQPVPRPVTDPTVGSRAPVIDMRPPRI